MATNAWRLAELNGEQLSLLQEAERTLGADILLAYRPSEQAKGEAGQVAPADLPVAPLNESQLECLQGLETQLRTIVIAYQQD